MAKQTLNEDLQKERTTCTFNLEELTNFLDGDKENTAKRRKLGKYLHNILIFKILYFFRF